jgi:hypothetical protein
MNAIARLKQSRKEFVQSERADGVRVARHWAENRASYEDLRRISVIGFEILESASNIESALKMTLDPDAELDVKEFREHLFLDDCHSSSRFGVGPSDPFLLGFIEGAQEFFDNNKDAIETD